MTEEDWGEFGYDNVISVADEESEAKEFYNITDEESDFRDRFVPKGDLNYCNMLTSLTYMQGDLELALKDRRYSHQHIRKGKKLVDELIKFLQSDLYRKTER